ACLRARQSFVARPPTDIARPHPLVLQERSVPARTETTMTRTDRTIQKFREEARQDGYEFIAMFADGHLCLCSTPTTGPAFIGYAPAESSEAAELIRRAVEEFGHVGYVSEAEVLGGEAEVQAEMECL